MENLSKTLSTERQVQRCVAVITARGSRNYHKPILQPLSRLALLPTRVCILVRRHRRDVTSRVSLLRRVDSEPLVSILDFIPWYLTRSLAHVIITPKTTSQGEDAGIRMCLINIDKVVTNLVILRKAHHQLWHPKGQLVPSIYLPKVERFPVQTNHLAHLSGFGDLPDPLGN